MKKSHPEYRAMVAALADAVTAVGGAAEMARILDITSQAVSSWQRCPATRVLALEKISGVSRHELRPDVFGPAEA